MSRSVRFFEIIQILRKADRPVTAQSLADRLEVNIRTIYRDIASLQASRLPIEGEAGFGYVMRKGFDLPPLMFNQVELEAITVGLSMIPRSGDGGLMAAGQSVLKKIADVVPETIDLDIPLHVSQWNSIPRAGLDPKMARQLIREEAKVRIQYRDLGENESTRVIKPVALSYHVDAIVLAGWCELRHEFRHFRIDRIEKWEMTGSNFRGEGKILRKQWEAVV